MKKTVISLLVCFLVLGTLGMHATAKEGTKATHTSLTEDATATWCGYCKYAAAALKELYAEGNLDFYFVSLVDDKCTKAATRINQYNLYGFPTVFHDGGYKVNVGAGSTQSAKTAYTTSLTACGNRAVPDIDVDVRVEWLGGALMRITATVTNNEATTYDGRIRAYITENESSLNWRDTANKLYHFPLLDFAFNTVISIPAGDAWTTTVTWDGATHNSGHGQSYGNIKYDNITVIAAVFNSTVHQGYAYPPSSNPFNAYYVDDTAAAMADDLSADVYTLPETGGSINFGLYAGSEHQGRNYLLACGVTGSTPGTTLPGGMVLPVNFDVFTYNILFPLLNTSLFMDFYGNINAEGTAAAQLNSGTLPPGYTGTVLTFAYCLNDPFDYVSMPIDVEIVP
ncbi:MAG: thioredoxin domain-containing protein [Planctomycetota bacterium]